MRRFRFPALFCLFVTLAGILAWYFAPGPIDADIYEEETLNVDGTVRRFRLVVPRQTLLRPTPVVFAFHGLGDSTESMAAYSKLDRLSAENGFLLVYPAAVRSMWSTEKIDPDNLDQNRDVSFFAALLDHLEERFEVDSRRIYLVGMSNGASFAQVVAFARDDIAAVVAHSGTKPQELKRATHPFPILLVAGDEDGALEFVRAAAAAYREDGHIARFIEVPGLGHEWSTEHNPEFWAFLSKHECND